MAQAVSLPLPAIAAALSLVLLGVLNRGAQARAAYRIVELPASLPAMVRLSAVSYAANKVAKSGGAAGVLPYLADARAGARCRGDVIGAYLCMQIAGTLALCALIAVAVGGGALVGALHGLALGGAVASLAYAALMLAFLVLVVRRRATVAVLARATRRLPATAAADLWGVGEALDRVRADPTRAAPLLAAAFAGKLIGATALAVVLAGLHAPVGIGTTLLVYTLTVMASAFGPLPAGAGAAEASLGGLLVASGTPAGTAAAVVIAFRLVDLWLPLLVGGLAAVRWRRHRPIPDHAAPVPVLEPAA
jgi:uncharacterized membrane protein YbhN (UPF0104 family)